MNGYGLRSRLHDPFENPIQFKDGRMAVPDGPGLGLDLDEQKIDEMHA